jgi:hypothetical protein
MTVQIEVKTKETVRGIGQADNRVADALDYAVNQVALAIERETKITLNNNPHTRVKNKGGKGVHWEPRGHIGGRGTPPNRRSGDLLRSVRTRRVQGLKGFIAEVSPGMIYARRLEVSKSEGGFGYPYLRPSVDRVRPRANKIASQAFARKWKG